MSGKLSRDGILPGLGVKKEKTTKTMGGTRRRKRSSFGIMKSAGGMFDAKDICDIIRTSAESSVSRLEIGDLKIHFGPESQFSPASLGFLPESQNPQTEVTLTEDQKMEMEEANHQQLAILDPVSFEQEEEDRFMDLHRGVDAGNGLR